MVWMHSSIMHVIRRSACVNKMVAWCQIYYRTAAIKLLAHWGRVTYICVSKLTVIGSDNGLSPERRQTIIWTNAGILLIGTPETNLGEILSEIHTFSFKKMHLKTSSAKWRPFCLGLNVLNHIWERVGSRRDVGFCVRGGFVLSTW